MTPKKQTLLTAALALAAIGSLVPAQRVDRLSTAIGNDKIRLRGSRHARIEKLTGGGPVDDSMRVAGISFRFRPTDEQQSELDHLLEEQQNPWSPLYHAWLTPEEFGDRFGLGANDYAKVRRWVESQGFQVDDAALSRTYISFSGTARQVRQTFLTDLRRFDVQGETRYANVDEIALPKELESIVSHVRGLDDFESLRGAASPRQINLRDGVHAVSPGDLNIIYNVKPLHDRGLTGEGVKIVVVGKSRFELSDVRTFRGEFGLPPRDPQMILVPGFSDPGFNEEHTEALLDVQYAGAAAPGAPIVYVYAPFVQAASEYAIDRNLGPVLSESFASCETQAAQMNGMVARVRNVAQQAVAQGITYLAISGDTGPSACEYQLEDEVGLSLAVSVSASVPEVTAVGGTSFDEQQGIEYWNSKSTETWVSARSYIPEKAWNDTAINRKLAASGGGPSSLYPRPAWQTVPGVPNGNTRLLPDVSFTASWLHDPYIIVKNGDLTGFGGTSASTPFFAGVVALLNHHVVRSGAQVRPGLGNINPRLYQLSQSAPSVFHDIVKGDTIIPCKTGTPGCMAGSYGYKAGPGYDLATGLGSIDVKNLFDNWIENKTGSAATSLTLTATPATLAANGSALLTASVKAGSGKESPTGPVTFRLGQTGLGTANLVGSGGTAMATYSVAARELAAGANAITASYAGSDGFGASSGSAVITVAGQQSGSAVVPTVTPNPVYRSDADEEGYEWFYSVQLKETGGVATKLTGFSVEGYDLSEYIAQWFGTANLAANGTLRVEMRANDMKVPTDVVFAFAGVDANGRKWSKQIPVPFLGRKEGGGGGSGPAASMSLTSVPASVVKSGKGDPNCAPERPYYQKLALREENGVDVQLTKFVAGGNDYTNSIGAWFGSARLPGNGTLTAGLCWQLDRVPVTLEYQMDGVDRSGKAVQAKTSVYFWSLDSKSGDELPAFPGAKAAAWPALTSFAPEEMLRKPGRSLRPRHNVTPAGAAAR